MMLDQTLGTKAIIAGKTQGNIWAESGGSFDFNYAWTRVRPVLTIFLIGYKKVKNDPTPSSFVVFNPDLIKIISEYYTTLIKADPGSFKCPRVSPDEIVQLVSIATWTDPQPTFTFQAQNWIRYYLTNVDPEEIRGINSTKSSSGFYVRLTKEAVFLVFYERDAQRASVYASVTADRFKELGY